jgi:alpha-galactosidase
MSEYVPYFRRTRKMIRQYRLIRRRRRHRPRRPWLTDPNTPVPDLTASDEYASGIIEAVTTNRPFRFNGNVMNRGAITNLPAESCVELPCLADGQGIHACHVGDLPPQLAAINRSNIAVQELAVRAVMDRDRQAAFHAVAVDPLTASVAPLERIREMFDELWKAERHMLRYFDE